MTIDRGQPGVPEVTDPTVAIARTRGLWPKYKGLLNCKIDFLGDSLVFLYPESHHLCPVIAATTTE
jgi:hypothetical protein